MPVTADEARSAGDDPAVASCVRAFERELDFVYRVLRRQGVSPTDAEDLAQEVFLILWRRWDDYRQDRPLRPWLGGIAARVAMKHRERRRRLEVPLGSLETPDRAALPDDDLAAARARNLARQAIALLPDRHRAALVMHEIDEIPVKDLAAVWAVPLFTAYTRVRVARAAFAKIATELLGKPDRSRPPLSPAALLAIERAPEPAPEQTRKGVEARLRALLLLPPARWPRPDLDVPPPAGGGVLFPALVALAVAVAGLGALGLFFSQRHAHVNDASPERDPRVSLAPTRPPRLLVPAPQPRVPPRAPPVRLAPAAALARGLVGHWRLDDGPGATARDSSGHAHDCVVRGRAPQAAWIEGAHGGALRFDRDRRLECPQPEAQTTAAAEVTLVAWMKPRLLSYGHRALAVRETDGELGDYFFLGLKGMDLVVTSRAWRANLVYPLPATADAWVQVAFTHARDGTTRLYVDGVEVAQSTSRRRGAVRVVGPLSIGAGLPQRGPARPRQAFHGDVDDVLLYDRALDKDEIAWLAAGTQPQAD